MELIRYMLTGVIRAAAKRRTGTESCLFYLDLFAPPGERVRTALEPIAEEL